MLPEADRLVDREGGSTYTRRGSGRYPSGQRELTVDQLAERLRRFESFPPHHHVHRTVPVMTLLRPIVSPLPFRGMYPAGRRRDRRGNLCPHDSVAAPTE